MKDVGPVFPSHRYLINRYLLALFIFAMIGTVSYFYNLNFSRKIENEPFIVNQLGRQKATALNILITMKSLHEASDENEKLRLQNELEDFIDDLTDTAELIKRELKSSQLIAIYNGPKGVYENQMEYLKSIHDYIFGTGWSDMKYNELAHFGRDLLIPKLEVMANVFQKESEERNLAHDRFEMLFSLGILVTLLLQARFIFAPMVKKMRQAWRKLDKERNLYSKVLDNIPDAIYLKDRDHKFLLVNQAFTQEVGLPKDKIVGKTEKEVYYPAFAEKIWAQTEETFHHGGTIEHEDVTFPGSSREKHYITKKTVVKDGINELVVASIRDITDRGQAQKQLLISEQFQRSLLQSTPMGIFRLDKSGQISYANPYLVNLLGIKDVSPGNLDQEISVIKEVYQHLLHKEKDYLNKEYRFTKRNGEVLWLKITISEVQDENGVLSEYVGAVTDISELRYHQWLLENAESIAGLGNFETDIETMKTTLSKEARIIMGLKPHEKADDINWAKILHIDDHKPVWRTWKNSIANMAPYEIDFRLIREDGTIVYIHSIGRPIKEKRLRMTGIIQDVSKLKKAEMELESERMRVVNSSKMASLGEMAGGLAHEINNPTAIILGRVQQMKRLALKSEHIDSRMVIESTTKIEQTVERISKIISGLRRFSRNAEDDPFENASIRQIIDETLEFCRERLRLSEVELQFEKKELDINVSCKQVQISQVLLNLINNAYDAVMESEAPRWVKVHYQIEKDFVVISVSDSGKGIPVELRQKIMEPFFTTKGVGKGTGLGLSISSGIMLSHGGELLLDESCPNTCFVMKLPLNTAIS